MVKKYNFDSSQILFFSKKNVYLKQIMNIKA